MEAALIDGESQPGASFRRAGAAVDSYRIWTDGPVLRIDAKGFWDIAVADAYIGDITRIIARSRLARPQLRAIVDRSEVPLFAADVSERLLATYAKVLRAGDRIAMVVDTSLAKVNIRRIADREETQAFLSISAARTWVLAYG